MIEYMQNNKVEIEDVHCIKIEDFTWACKAGLVLYPIEGDTKAWVSVEFNTADFELMYLIDKPGAPGQAPTEQDIINKLLLLPAFTGSTPNP